MKSSTIFHLLGVAHAHTIMQSFNGNSQGAGIYMPSDDSVGNDSILWRPSQSLASANTQRSSFRMSTPTRLHATDHP